MTAASKPRGLWNIDVLLSRVTPHLRLVTLLVVALEFLLFQSFFQNDITPYYPRNYDQLVTYQAVYEAYFSIRDHGWLEAVGGDLGIKRLGYKGIVVPTLGLLSMCLVGPGRLALGAVNFAFFVLGQVVVWRFFDRRVGLAGALLAWGLFLFASSHYFWAGGLDDLRFDHAGKVAFGVAFLTLWSFLEAPTWKSLWSCLAVFAFALGTRSISMLYLLGAQTIVVAVLAIRWIAMRKPDTRLRLGSLLLVGSMVEFGVFLLVLGHRFIGYYGSLLVTDESSIRDLEFGVRTSWDRSIYYLRSAVDHFGTYLAVGAIIGSCILLEWARRRLGGRRPDSIDLPFAHPRMLLLLWTATAVFTYGILTLYSPSPVVIGVLTIPTLCLLVVLVVNGLVWLRSASALRTIAVVVAMLGFGTYSQALTAPRWTSPQFRSDATIINGFFRDLAGFGELSGNQTRVQWLLVHDGVNDLAFTTFLYEHDPRSAALGFRHRPSGIFSLSRSDLQERIANADIVIVPVEMEAALDFEYPFTRSLRDLSAQWRSILDREFMLTGRYPVSGGQIVVGAFARPVMVVGYRAPNGIERRSDGRQFFWLGNKSAEMRLRNFGATDREIEVVVQTRPGPSNADQTRRMLRYEFMGRQGMIALSQAGDWKMSLPLSLRPGSNSLLLWVADQSDPSLNGNGDPRDLLLLVGDVQVGLR